MWATAASHRAPHQGWAAGAPSRKSVKVERLFVEHQIVHLGLCGGRIPSQTVLHTLLDSFFIVVSPTQENTQGIQLPRGKIVRHGGEPLRSSHWKGQGKKIPNPIQPGLHRESQTSLGYGMRLCDVGISLSGFAFWVLMRGCGRLVISLVGLRPWPLSEWQSMTVTQSVAWSWPQRNMVLTSLSSLQTVSPCPCSCFGILPPFDLAAFPLCSVWLH